MGPSIPMTWLSASDAHISLYCSLSPEPSALCGSTNTAFAFTGRGQEVTVVPVHGFTTSPLSSPAIGVTAAQLRLRS